MPLSPNFGGLVEGGKSGKGGKKSPFFMIFWPFLPFFLFLCLPNINLYGLKRDSSINKIRFNQRG